MTAETKKSKTAKSSGKIKVTLVRSGIGCNESQRSTIKGLGLRKINSSSVLENTPAVRGMITKINHLVEAEEVKG